MSERRYLTAAELAKHTRLSARWFTAHAREIPGACQPAGARGAWRFDERAFWRWWTERESKGGPGWRPSIGEADWGGGR